MTEKGNRTAMRTERVSGAMVASMAHRLDGWLSEAGATESSRLSVDLADIYAACAIISQSIEHLISSELSSDEKLRALIEIETWAYGDLSYHLRRMRAPLTQLINRQPE